MRCPGDAGLGRRRPLPAQSTTPGAGGRVGCSTTSRRRSPDAGAAGAGASPAASTPTRRPGAASGVRRGAAAVAAARRVGGAWSLARRRTAPRPCRRWPRPRAVAASIKSSGSRCPLCRRRACATCRRLTRAANAPTGGRAPARCAGAGRGGRARARRHDDAAALSRNAVVLAEMKRDIDALLAEAQVAPPPQ